MTGTLPGTEAPSRRPTGVTLLGILGILAGLFWGLLALVLLVVGSLLGALIGGAIAGEAGAGAGAAVGGVLSLLFFALAIASFVAGIGLLARKRWGWYMGLAWAILQIVQAVVSFLGVEPVSGLLGAAIGGVIVWYLLTPPVQAWFGVSYRVPWARWPAPRG